jgi:signal transduction histidine kinase
VHSVQPAGQKLVDASLRAIEFHARTSHRVAGEIRDARRHTVHLTSALMPLCTGLAVAGIFLVMRQSRRHRAVVDAYTRFQEARANELEQFAGRVAHDIRNPLSAVQMTAELALSSTADTAIKGSLARILRSLARANAITSALLEFARSGAQPDPGARTDPAEVLRDISGAISTEAEQLHVDFRIEAVPPVLVACSTGVYLSLIGNFLRNAMKHMGDSTTRRIVVRVRDEGTCVRTEVTDTGPGIAAQSLPSLFDPYFRGAHDRGTEGLGLGLATVKKLAEGHHGCVGVASEPGTGSTFWFTLPRAGSPPTASDLQDRHECHPVQAQFCWSADIFCLYLVCAAPEAESLPYQVADCDDWQRRASGAERARQPPALAVLRMRAFVSPRRYICSAKLRNQHAARGSQGQSQRQFSGYSPGRPAPRSSRSSSRTSRPCQRAPAVRTGWCWTRHITCCPTPGGTQAPRFRSASGKRS